MVQGQIIKSLLIRGKQGEWGKFLSLRKSFVDLVHIYMKTKKWNYLPLPARKNLVYLPPLLYQSEPLRPERKSEESFSFLFAPIHLILVSPGPTKLLTFSSRHHVHSSIQTFLFLRRRKYITLVSVLLSSSSCLSQYSLPGLRIK